MSKNNFTIESLDAFYCILKQEVEKNGAKMLDKKAVRENTENIPGLEWETAKVKFLVDFGESGFHLPEIDRVVYDAKSYEAIAVIFSSPDIAWGIAESVYWKMKYNAVRLTKHIKVCFVASGKDNTLDDEDKLTAIWKFKRELDGCYTLHENSESQIEFDSLNMLLDDVKDWAKNNPKVKR